MESLNSDRLKKIIKVNYEDLKMWATMLKENQQESRALSKSNSHTATQLSSFSTAKSSVTSTMHSYAKLKSHNPTPHHSIANSNTQKFIDPMIRQYRHTKLRHNKMMHSFGETINKSCDKKEGKCPIMPTETHKSVTFRILNDSHHKNPSTSAINANYLKSSQRESKNDCQYNANENNHFYSHNIPNFTTTLNSSKPKLPKKMKVGEEFKTKYVNLMIRPDVKKMLRRKLKPHPVQLTLLDKERIRRYLSIIKFNDHWTQKLLQLNTAEIEIKGQE